MKGRVLIVAGSDSGGGAGIQADIKAVTALGGYAMTAITALTAQNTKGVFAVHGVPPAFIARQIEVVLEDIGADCVKTGMLHTAEVIETVADALAAGAADVPLVVDPVMIAKGGASLLEAEAAETMKTRLVPMAALVTPNLPEAEVLSSVTIGGPEDMAAAGAAILELGCRAVLVKGGHLPGDRLVDLLMTADGSSERFEDTRIDTDQTHGTGCTLASAIAVGLAQRLALRDAVARARAYVREAIRRAPGLGGGHGPLDHTHTVRPFPVSDA